MLSPWESHEHQRLQFPNLLLRSGDDGRSPEIMSPPQLELCVFPPHLAPLPWCPLCECRHYPPIFQARVWKSPCTSLILPPATPASASLCAFPGFCLRPFGLLFYLLTLPRSHPPPFLPCFWASPAWASPSSGLTIHQLP